MSNSKKHFAIFNGKEIRKIIHNDEWYFVIVDVVAVLTGSVNPTGYLKDMKRRDLELSKGWRQIATPLLIKTKGGNQKINCATTEGIFRIIQSIPSPKAEPFKKWLAKVGHERIKEIENPELAIERMKSTYRYKGYSEEWIDKRLRGIKVRKELTDEWSRRDIDVGIEYSILTAEISKATFGMTPGEYKEFKDLDNPSDNLRDHMTDLELIFTMLGEASTKELVESNDVHGLESNIQIAKKGGQVAGVAKKELEKNSGRSIITSLNYKEITEQESRQQLEKNEN